MLAPAWWRLNEAPLSCGNLGLMSNTDGNSERIDEGAVVLVRGDDLVLRDTMVRELTRSAANGEDLSLALDEFGTSDDFDIAAAIDAAMTPPMFSSRRVVLVRDVGRLDTAGAELLLDYLSGPSPTTTLILVGGGGTVPKKVVDALKRLGAIVETGAPTGKARQTWVDERLASAPVKLDRHAAQRLTDHLGDGLSRIDGIVSVLAAVYGEGSRIGIDELEPFLGGAGSGAPWDLTDAIDRGDAAAALDQLRRQMNAGERHSLQIMASLTAHFTKMLRLSGVGIRDENEAAKALGITGSTFPAKKALNQAKKLGPHGVARGVHLLAEADLDLRGRRDVPGDVVMEVLIARLARLSTAATASGGRR
jgi:DNA polymerase III subunit delta